MTDRPDPEQSAEKAGLHYGSDGTPGITRHRAGTGWFYRNAKGEKVDDDRILARIKTLAIPPAWTDVWIAPSANSHLQATGRDAKGRKQYRYHPRWSEVRDAAKYNRMIAFGEALPGIRERVDDDLGKRGLPREKVLAALVKLLETTFIRVGNDQYARENDSYGLTTLHDHHADIHGDTITFSFSGKSGVEHEIQLTDRRLARVVRKCQELPGQHLFQYLDDEGNRQTVSSTDVNDYLKAISDHDFTAKDYRTWAGTMLAAEALAGYESEVDESTAKHNIVAAIQQVAKQLGNTPSICRKCYVHPVIIDAYLEGTAIAIAAKRSAGNKKKNDLQPVERAVLDLLKQHQNADNGVA